jgi:hypothetical protein
MITNVFIKSRRWFDSDEAKAQSDLSLSLLLHNNPWQSGCNVHNGSKHLGLI